MTDVPETTPAEREGCAQIFVALLGASLLAALLVTIGFWAGLVWIFFWLIWFVTLGIAVLIGLPAYFGAAAFGRVGGWSAAGAGMVAGAVLPLLLVSFSPDKFSAEALAIIAAFAACGAAAGLIFLLILRWRRLPGIQRVTMGSAAVAAGGLAFCGAWIAQDHSCHNPVWYGQGIAPSASFSVRLPAGQWRMVSAEIDRFAKDKGWSVRTDASFTADRPWFQMSACRADGTDINVTQYDPAAAFGISVYQPQGGDSWKTPARELHMRIHKRWPNAVEYTDGLGRPTARPPDWLGSARPTPAPSSTVR